MIDVNIKGVLYGIAAALPHMQKQKSGHIINVSSVAGHKVGPGGVVYAATKHAVRVISEGLRQKVKPYNIRTTIISPGGVATELTRTITDPVIAEAHPADQTAQDPARRWIGAGYRRGRGCYRDAATPLPSADDGAPARQRAWHSSPE
jgi:NADP-dependent 3-hydroxy acid dehydrogenase YdfG